MRTDLTYTESREEPESKVEERLKEDWKQNSDVIAVRVPNLDKNIPHFVFYA